jgi:uncharacterized protein YecE (DUF72 family)
MSRNVYLGVAGWSYPDWKGTVYPDTRADQLKFLSRFVDCIEINSTFYRPPEEKNAKSWLARTSEKKDFFFTAKLHRDFTHEGKIEPQMVEQFHHGFEPMLKEDKLKKLLVQFRYNFQDTEENREHLEKIIKNFSDTFDLAVELRHKSWENPAALDFLENLKVTVCNLDYPTTYNSFDMKHCTIGKNGYFRLHGRNVDKWFSKSTRDETYDYYYNDKELTEIKDRIQRLADAYKFLIVIANNHYRGAELANALQLKYLLTDQKQLVPRPLLQTYPNLAKISAGIHST